MPWSILHLLALWHQPAHPQLVWAAQISAQYTPLV